MLSQSNIDKLVLTGLYGHEPRKSRGQGDDPLWCTNWTFTVSGNNGTYHMRDTYWSSGDFLSFELTDENFNEFTFLFDFAKVTKTSRDIWQEYDESNKFWVPTDSGGMYCGGSYFILKGAKPSKALKHEILLSQIRDAENTAKWKKDELSRLENDGMGGMYE
jgi:hypothetical protein